jgi:hypothetical protein
VDRLQPRATRAQEVVDADHYDLDAVAERQAAPTLKGDGEAIVCVDKNGWRWEPS